MKSLLLAAAVVLLAGSTALAHHVYYVAPMAPAPMVVQSYYPAPIYDYPPVVVVPRRPWVAAPLVAPVPVYAPPVVVVRPRLFYPGYRAVWP
jgi:hypothetical protein